MDYLRQSLSEDETLIHIARFHWMYTVNAVFNAVFGLVLSIFIIWFTLHYKPIMFGTIETEGLSLIEQIRELHPGIKILSFFVFLMMLLKCAQMMIVKATTEIGVTDMRLVYKRGLVARSVGEINIDRIEGVNVIQGVLGRIFGYGRVIVRGMGIGEVVLPPIQQPIRFKKAIEKARNMSKRNSMIPPGQI